ncbi:MAG: SH3 domain-containing protein [Clostridiales bacterium]|nr:SH3 domain-containing protein [Clostridiales bacterium]
MATVKQKYFSMKRFVFFLLVIILGTTISAIAWAAEFATVYNTQSLNLRQQPSSSSTWLGAYNQGSWVEVVGQSDNWYQVKTLDGKSGYMSANYLNIGIQHTSTIGYINNPNHSTYTNVRNQPNYSGGVIASYYNGTPMMIYENTSGWYKADINGNVGYVLASLVRTTQGIGSNDIATIVTPNNTGLNLRQGPSPRYNSTGLFGGGRYVMVLNRGNGWWKVSIDNQIGYMDTAFLKEGVLSGGNSGGGGNNSGNELPGGTYALVKNPGANQILNLRDQPSQTARSIGQYKNNTQVSILEQGVQWSKVTVASTGKTGWMMSRYLQLYNLPGNPVQLITHPNKSYVNLRKSASISNNIITRLNHGTAVTILAPGNQWTKVQYNDSVGYVMSIYLK